jgi:hypothetical protein
MASPLVYDEVADGDLSNRNEYIGDLGEGVNTITGASSAKSNPTTVDNDWPRVGLPAGYTITSVTVDLNSIYDKSSHMSFGFNVKEYNGVYLAKHVFHLNSNGLNEDDKTSRTIYSDGDTLLQNEFKLNYPLAGDKIYELSLVSFSGQRFDLDVDYKWKIIVEPLFVNNSPSVTITSPNDGDAFTSNGEAIVLEANATDLEDGDSLGQVVWNSSIDGEIFSPASLSIGIHLLSASVQDSHGADAINTVSIQVKPEYINTIPTIVIEAPISGSTVQSNGPAVTLIAKANDFEDGDISANVTWMSDLDGELISPTTLSEGVHIVTASIEDSHGDTATETTTITAGAFNLLYASLLLLLGGFKRKRS